MIATESLQVRALASRPFYLKIFFSFFLKLCLFGLTLILRPRCSALCLLEVESQCFNPGLSHSAGLKTLCASIFVSVLLFLTLSDKKKTCLVNQQRLVILIANNGTLFVFQWVSAESDTPLVGSAWELCLSCAHGANYADCQCQCLLPVALNLRWRSKKVMLLQRTCWTSACYFDFVWTSFLFPLDWKVAEKTCSKNTGNVKKLSEPTKFFFSHFLHCLKSSRGRAVQLSGEKLSVTGWQQMNLHAAPLPPHWVLGGTFFLSLYHSLWQRDRNWWELLGGSFE